MTSAARRAPALVMVAGAALAACGSSNSGTEAAADTSNATTVNVSLTSGGCVADPAGEGRRPLKKQKRAAHSVNHDAA